VDRQPEFDEAQVVEPQFPSIEYRVVTADKALRLESAQPGMAGRWREMHPRGQFPVTDTAVQLQLLENLAIVPVQLLSIYTIVHSIMPNLRIYSV
jgi:hypothetical protein